jgi:hypothetical protein
MASERFVGAAASGRPVSGKLGEPGGRSGRLGGQDGADIMLAPLRAVLGVLAGAAGIEGVGVAVGLHPPRAVVLALYLAGQDQIHGGVQAPVQGREIGPGLELLGGAQDSGAPGGLVRGGSLRAFVVPCLYKTYVQACLPANPK